MNKKKILICDDEEWIRESLKLILENDYSLVFANCGRECIETLTANDDISLILLDIKMPKQNGLEITRQIKAQFPNKKVIIVTGYKSTEVAQEAIKSGADDFIIKPFESQDILKKTAEYTK